MSSFPQTCKSKFFVLTLSFFISNAHEDREFQALSESMITFLKTYFYTNNEVEIQRNALLKKFSLLGLLRQNSRFIFQHINVKQDKNI